MLFPVSRFFACCVEPELYALELVNRSCIVIGMQRVHWARRAHLELPCTCRMTTAVRSSKQLGSVQIRFHQQGDIRTATSWIGSAGPLRYEP
jgi:hypothetical protein